MIRSDTHSDAGHSRTHHPRRSGGRRTAARALAPIAGLGLLGGAGAVTGCSSEPGPGTAASSFAAAWSGGSIATSRLRFVDANRASVPAATVAQQLTAVSGDLAERRPTVKTDGNPKTGAKDTATVRMNVRWPVANDVTWTYRTSVAMRHTSAGWAVVWAPSVVHPDLHGGDHLVVARTMPDRAQILDGAGTPLVTNRPVVTIQAHPKDITDKAVLVRALTDALASVGVQLDAKELTARLNSGSPDAYLELVTLRRDSYDTIRSLIHELPGLSFREGSLPLAPTATWGRGVLGKVGQVQKDRMDARPGVYAVGELVGYGGLQEKFDDRLRGTPGVTVSAGAGGAAAGDGDSRPGRELFRSDTKPGEPLKTTLDAKVEDAAEKALAALPRTAALVAIRISDGAILADANSGPDAGAANLGFTAAVPPGSTFKMVTAYGLLTNGSITPDTVVSCPKTLTVGGMTFHNSHDFVLGDVPMHTNFARSCNTAFASLAPKLGSDGLARAAADLGIGTVWTTGLDAFTGKVATGGSADEQAAAAFGQGRTQVSPLAMAAAAAAVSRGQWQQPVLVVDPAQKAAPPGPQLKPEVLAALKTMMREVVTGGTATAVRNVPGAPIYGKTGTAEYDSNPDHSHSWFIGFRGDIAFAAFVQDGGNTSDAVPLVGRFLSQLG